jgi:hypothetical protein
MWAYVMFFLLSGLGVPFSLYFGIKAKKEILKHPNIYKGIKLARFIIYLNTILLITTALLILLVISNPYSAELFVLILLGFLLALIIGSIIIFTAKD